MSAHAQKIARLPVAATVLRAKSSHIARLVQYVRAADAAELWSGWRHTPEQSLRVGLERSSHAWTGFYDFRPVCMFGVVPASLLGGSGAPWLIGTDLLTEHQIPFLRRCRPQVARMRRLYSHLANYVSAENEAAVRWLTWLGFTVHDPAPFGPDGAAFRYFEWRAADV